MSNNIIPPEVEAVQRKVAVKAEEDAALVAAVAIAFEAGKAFGEGLARQEKEA